MDSQEVTEGRTQRKGRTKWEGESWKEEGSI
jgi:hypothetical protein